MRWKSVDAAIATPAVILLAMMVAIPGTRAQEPVAALDRTFPIGSDFCFSRSYDPAHMAAHPRQLVRAITVMGRNAHRTAKASGAGPTERTVSGYNVRASLRITFRDGSTREWPGTCHEVDALPGYRVVCTFVPHRTADVVEFALGLRRSGTSVQAATRSDITAFRYAREDGSGPDGVQSDDAAFALEAMPASSCDYAKKYWTKKGATGALESALP